MPDTADKLDQMGLCIFTPAYAPTHLPEQSHASLCKASFGGDVQRHTSSQAASMVVAITNSKGDLPTQGERETSAHGSSPRPMSLGYLLHPDALLHCSSVAVLISTLTRVHPLQMGEQNLCIRESGVSEPLSVCLPGHSRSRHSGIDRTSNRSRSGTRWDLIR